MDIVKMHSWFRTYAQQMGMQNVRAILPEQIDILINTSILDTVNQLIATNIGITNDRVITDNSKIGQINSLRTLYKVVEIDCLSKSIPVKGYYNSKITWRGAIATTTINILDSGTIISSVVCDGQTQTFSVDSTYPLDVVYSNFTVTPVSGEDDLYDMAIQASFYYDEEQLDITLNGTDYATIGYARKYPFEFNGESPFTGQLKGVDILDNYMFLVDFSLSYTKVTGGVNVVEEFDAASIVGGDLAFISNYFPVRLIDDAYLADSLNDFILSPRMTSPILTIYNGNTFDLYVGKFKKVAFNNYTLDNNLLPYKFRISYIKKPAVVKLAENLGGQNVDCDLPSNLHIDILKHAVDLYRVAVSGALYGAQQQTQQQQQEDTRNNYRNEGNSEA